MWWRIAILSLIGYSGLAQEVDEYVKPDNGFHLSLSVGTRVLTSYQTFNDNLGANGISPMSNAALNLNFGLGFYHKKSDFFIDVYTIQGNNGGTDSTYQLNLACSGFNFKYACDLLNNRRRWTFKPFTGVGINTVIITGQNNGDSTITYDEFIQQGYNFYFNRSSWQLNLEAGLYTSLFWFYPSVNSELFLIAAYSQGLINYQWQANDLPVKSTTGLNLMLGARFNLKRMTDRRRVP